MSLALATLIYEWRRYLAAIFALAVSGLMVLVFNALFAGIIHSELATTERSRADIFVLPAKSKSIVNSNASLPARVKPMMYLNPHVVDAKSLDDAFGQWVNKAHDGQPQVETFINIWAIDTAPSSVTLPVDYTEEQRIALMEPMAVAVDETLLKRLGVKLGDHASVNGKAVWVRAVLHNYPSLEQPTISASRETVRRLQRGGGGDGSRIGPLMVRLDNPAVADTVRDDLNARSGGAYRAWTRKDFMKANEDAVMGQQIIGIVMVFLTTIAALIGLGITSQTLRSAILSNIREFASLRALGISMGSLRLIVIELSFWAGVAGILLAGLLTFVASTVAGAMGLPLVIQPMTALVQCGILMIIAVVSGAMAMGVLKHSQPADLLR